MKKALLLFTALGCLAVGSSVLALALRQRSDDAPRIRSGSTQVRAARKVDSTQPLTEFTLIERSGADFDSANLKGQVWVASFFFSACPFSCKQQNGRFAELQKEYGPKGVRFVSITCDPKTDTPERLADYAKSFDADPKQWLFLTGEMDYIARVGQDIFKVPVAEQGHTEKFVLVDQQGEIRGYYFWKDPLEITKMKRMIDDLLAGTAPPLEVAEPSASEAAHGAAPNGA